MVVYQGFASLRETTTEIDDGGLSRIAAQIQHRIEEQTQKGTGIGMRIVNGQYQLWFSGCVNHWGSDIEDVMEFLRLVATLAPGSYGLIYVWNDEDPRCGNEFRVWKLAKGTVSQLADPFLSPCIPIIEDTA